MYPSNFNSLSLGKIIGGLSKTLNIVNQALPLYKQIKPIIKNASGILSVFKEFNKPDTPSSPTNFKEKSTQASTVDAKIIETSSLNIPTFFQ